MYIYNIYSITPSYVKFLINIVIVRWQMYFQNTDTFVDCGDARRDVDETKLSFFLKCS